jgi:iron-only hydrogenase group A
MKKEINLVIDGKRIKTVEEQTILKAAEENGIIIPTLCYHQDLKLKTSCRICVVSIVGKEGMFTACSTLVADGMEIITDSLEIRRVRKINLELIMAQHCEQCADCVWRYRCKLKDLAKEYGADMGRFKDRKKGFAKYNFGPSVEFDSSKCIDCRNCIEICQSQGVGHLELEKKDTFFRVVPSKDPKKECIYCGQCITHCPAGAFEGIGEFEEIEDPLEGKGKTVVFQFAPAVRAAIGEEFGLPCGTEVTRKLAGAIKALGVNVVFDVAVAADVTTMEEARELVERISNNEELPMFTSCCPAWVRFLELQYPRLKKNLTTVKSPHMIMGGLIKTYWAKRQNIDPENIMVVSVMPCVSKKYEITRAELWTDGICPVDMVLTTRELAFLLKKHHVDLAACAESVTDELFEDPTGAGVIYGASGGVMESALRTAHWMLTGKNMPSLDFMPVRGLEGVKEASVGIAGKSINVAVVSGTGNAKNLLEQLEKNPEKYTYIEVMACPGGCVAGGGQPVPIDDGIRQKRSNALYDIDKESDIRCAHESEAIKKIYDSFLADEKKRLSVCYSKSVEKN